MRHARASAGFSLVELIVSLLILSLGTASVFALFAVGAASHRRAMDLSTAARAAETVFAELEASWTVAQEAVRAKARPKGRSKTKGAAVDLDYPSPPDPGAPPWEVPGYPAYRYDVAFAPVGERGDAALATVTVFWKRKDMDNQTQFKRILLKRPF